MLHIVLQWLSNNWIGCLKYFLECFASIVVILGWLFKLERVQNRVAKMTAKKIWKDYIVKRAPFFHLQIEPLVYRSKGKPFSDDLQRIFVYLKQWFNPTSKEPGDAAYFYWGEEIVFKPNGNTMRLIKEEHERYWDKKFETAGITTETLLQAFLPKITNRIEDDSDDISWPREW